jgi:hypothetical protein
VLHSSIGSGATIGYQNTRVPNRRQNMTPCMIAKAPSLGPSKTDPPKALTTCQSLEARTTNSIPPEPCGKDSGDIGASSGIFHLARAPMTSSKRLTPSAYFCLTRGTCGTLRQDGEQRGLPIVTPAPFDGTDMTMHSQQEHGNHALTQHDPSHFTTMTSIPLQRRG